jgi:hypothetical protein
MRGPHRLARRRQVEAVHVRGIPPIPITLRARPTRAARLLLAFLLALSLAGCGRATTTPPDRAPAPSRASPSPPGRTAGKGPTAVGGARAAWAARDVAVWSRPGGGRMVAAFPVRQPWGDPIAFLIRRQVDQDSTLWYQVTLPRKPNGSTGWVRGNQVHVIPLVYKVEVDLSARELRLLRGDQVARRFRVAVGTTATPTPVGDFFLSAKLRPPQISPAFGSWALALSAWSPVLDQFGTGDGQIALHGTRNVTTLGKAVSHGCVRLDDRDVAELAELLPLGSPVRISP